MICRVGVRLTCCCWLLVLSTLPLLLHSAHLLRLAGYLFAALKNNIINLNLKFSNLWSCRMKGSWKLFFSARSVISPTVSSKGQFLEFSSVSLVRIARRVRKLSKALWRSQV